MGKFIDAYPPSKLNQKNIKNLHRSVLGREVKRVIKSEITENIPRSKSIMSKKENAVISYFPFILESHNNKTWHSTKTDT